MYTDPEFPAADAATGFHLRPLNTGEVFDRIFALYRQRFLMFVGIALLPAVVSLLSGVSRLLILRFGHLPVRIGRFATLPLIISGIVFGLLSLAAAGLTQAASVAAISDVYLGEETSIAKSFRVAATHWIRYAWLAVAQVLQASWLPAVIVAGLFFLIALVPGFRASNPVMIGGGAVLLVLAMIPYGFYRYTRVALMMPASVFEDLTVTPAFKRSVALTQERKWRIFLLFVVIGALYLVIGSGFAFLNFSAARGHVHLVVAEIVQLLVAFFTNILLQPLAAIGLCLFYFDERVRREGFDIELMMRQAQSMPDAGLTGVLEA
jgi:hypothetical protein